MLFEIAVDGDGRDLVLLRDWLIANPSLRRAATVDLTAPAAAPGTMGVSAEMITVVATVALDVGHLVTAVANWRATRRTSITVTIRRDDVEVTISGTDPAIVEKARRRLEEGRS